MRHMEKVASIVAKGVGSNEEKIYDTMYMNNMWKIKAHIYYRNRKNSYMLLE